MTALNDSQSQIDYHKDVLFNIVMSDVKPEGVKLSKKNICTVQITDDAVLSNEIVA